MGDSEHLDLGKTAQGLMAAPESLPPDERSSDKRTAAIDKLGDGIMKLSRETQKANAETARARRWSLYGVAVNVLVACVVLTVVNKVANETSAQLDAHAEKAELDDDLRKRSLEANATLSEALTHSLQASHARYPDAKAQLAAQTQAETLAIMAEAQSVAVLKQAEEATVKKAKIDRKPAPPAAAAKVRVLNDRLESVKRKAKKKGIDLDL